MRREAGDSGIATTDDLLERCSTPAGRDAVAGQRGVMAGQVPNETAVSGWVERAKTFDPKITY